MSTKRYKANNGSRRDTCDIPKNSENSKFTNPASFHIAKDNIEIQCGGLTLAGHSIIPPSAGLGKENETEKNPHGSR